MNCEPASDMMVIALQWSVPINGQRSYRSARRSCSTTYDLSSKRRIMSNRKSIGVLARRERGVRAVNALKFWRLHQTQAVATMCFSIGPHQSLATRTSIDS